MNIVREILKVAEEVTEVEEAEEVEPQGSAPVKERKKRAASSLRLKDVQTGENLYFQTRKHEDEVELTIESSMTGIIMYLGQDEMSKLRRFLK